MANENIGVIAELSKKLSKDAIQRTKGSETRKGYDTDGYSYQYCVDRFNEVLGMDWGYDYKILKEKEGVYNNGTPFYDITVEVSIYIMSPDTSRACAGSHISKNYGDALKGAITNAFKKTAAFWGVGADAYRGTIDDDNIPYPDTFDNIKTETGSEKSTGIPKKEFSNRNVYEWEEKMRKATTLPNLTIIATELASSKLNDPEKEELRKFFKLRMDEIKKA